jgi:transcriptional regulator GlxA family with amidase domain
VRPQLSNTAVIAWIQDSSRKARVVFSVCNGAFFLARAGLLDGLEATTFAHLIPQLKEAAPKARIVSDRRFVDNGKVVTAAGLSSGIDGRYVVEKLFGHGQAAAPPRARVQLATRFEMGARDPRRHAARPVYVGAPVSRPSVVRQERPNSGDSVEAHDR